MPKRVPGEGGTTAYVEFSSAELVKALEQYRPNIDLNITTEDLEEWSQAIPPARVEDGQNVYIIHSPKELDLIHKRALILRTRMSEKALVNIEEQNVLNAYAALAEDCPDGLTVHVWRSYGLVVLMQARHGAMIDAEELAQRARLSQLDPSTGKRVLGVDVARKHLRLLQALSYLKAVKVGEQVKQGERIYVAEKPEWLHQGLPQAWRQ